MLRKIKIYGRLAKFLKRRVFQAEVATAAEAVRFLLANFPHLEPELVKGHYRVSLGEYDLSEEELHDPAGQQDIRIIPVVAGAGVVGRILAGVALVALSFIGFGIPALAGVGVAGAFGSTLLFGVGASLILGGVAQLLTPVPKIGQLGANGDQDPRKTYSFSGIQNTSRQGTPVPIVYGETIVGSVVVSAGVDTVRVVG